MAVSPDPVSKPAIDLDAVRKSASHEQGVFTGNFRSHRLQSAFQPIFSLSHKRAVGYEALLRARDQAGNPVAPTNLFASDRQERETVFLDRLCRYLHLNNFKRMGDDLNWLFLNVSPPVMAHGPSYGPYFSQLLTQCAFPSHRVVIEIVEHPIADQYQLLETVHYYKEIGCLIAIDDFGAGHSNFERIWSLDPHIVKLDRSMIVRATQQKKIRQLFPNIVSLLHQAGSLVLVEGVETREQALIAMDSDIDFVQGYLFARPVTAPLPCPDVAFEFGGLFDEYKQLSANQEKHTEGIYRRYKALFMAAVDAMRKGMDFERACALLLEEEFVERCYLLQTDGIQVGRTIASPHGISLSNGHYRPLEDARSADWFRRHYLRRAIYHPDQLQISRPYLSITGGHMCTTFSMLFSAPAGNRIMCCDLWM